MIEPIDWQQPWLAAYREPGARIEARWRGGESLWDALNAERPSSLQHRFVPHAARGAAQAYETVVHERGEIPTRESLHDFFNGLVWLREPAMKVRVSELHAGEIARRGITGIRGTLRDALTLFDESGAWFRGPQELVDALRRRQWRRLFVDERARWREASVLIVGHALLEKLQMPRKMHTAHVLIDVAGALDVPHLIMKPFLPLPVLGVPGWWAANDNHSFYDDPSVFRPEGSPRSISSARRCRS
ncbi:MAG TPA: DUF3025 domain-containing protein [Burkholderiaceae bacterium]|nr:DUF3025 domain-containing protein [Burkholderiaceae bacterium]